MADDFEKSFTQIAELLKQDGVVESLKGILGGLGGSSSEKDSDRDEKGSNGDEKNSSRTDKGSDGGEKAGNRADKDSGKTSDGSGNAISNAPKDDMRLVLNIARAMAEYKSANDPSANLLAAIKPFLNEKRQKACLNCVKVLKMAKVYEYVKKHGEDFAL